MSTYKYLHTLIISNIINKFALNKNYLLWSANSLTKCKVIPMPNDISPKIVTRRSIKID